MPDPRFFPAPAPMRLAEVAEITGAALSADCDPDHSVSGVAPLALAGAADAAFLLAKKDPALAADSAAGALFVTAETAQKLGAGRNLLIHADPQRAWVLLARRLYPDTPPEPGVHPRAHVAEDAVLGAGCEVQAGAVIGGGAEIGAGSRIGAGAVIGPGVILGAGARIGPNVTITHALLGDRVIVHANAVIGQDGFGYIPGEAGLVKIPQLGRVVIGEDVEIGANTTIDRGAAGDTEIGAGTKIDNLVQVGHNCRIGRHCVLVSQVGLSGSVTVGDFAQLGGKVGVADHVRIGTGARVAARSGVTKHIPDGETYAGFPARPVKEWRQDMLAQKRLRATGKRD